MGIEEAIKQFIALLLAGTGAEVEITIHVTVRAGKGEK